MDHIFQQKILVQGTKISGTKIPVTKIPVSAGDQYCHFPKLTTNVCSVSAGDQYCHFPKLVDTQDMTLCTIDYFIDISLHESFFRYKLWGDAMPPRVSKLLSSYRV